MSAVAPDVTKILEVITLHWTCLSSLCLEPHDMTGASQFEYFH